MVRAAGRRALTVSGDVRSQADLDRAVAETLAEFGHLDVLIANAGVISMGTLWELPDEK